MDAVLAPTVRNPHRVPALGARAFSLCLLPKPSWHQAQLSASIPYKCKITTRPLRHGEALQSTAPSSRARPRRCAQPLVPAWPRCTPQPLARGHLLLPWLRAEPRGTRAAPLCTGGE